MTLQPVTKKRQCQKELEVIDINFVHKMFDKQLKRQKYRKYWISFFKSFSQAIQRWPALVTKGKIQEWTKFGSLCYIFNVFMRYFNYPKFTINTKSYRSWIFSAIYDWHFQFQEYMSKSWYSSITKVWIIPSFSLCANIWIFLLLDEWFE